MNSWLLVAAAAAALLLLPRLLRGRVASPDDVRARVAAGALVVDVRSAGEFGSGAYPGAVNIPLPSLRARLGELPRGRPLVVYCASGMRSAAAARLLRGQGYDVVNGGGLRELQR